MPVVTPGRRPAFPPIGRLRSSPLSGGGKKSMFVSLNLTPMVDMLTMLVVFLLSTFSASGEIMMVQRGLKLPSAVAKTELERAPLLIIAIDTITLNGEEMGDPRTIKDDPTDKIPALTEKLTALQAEEEAVFEPSDTVPVWPGRIILQADRTTPSEVLNKVTTILYLTKWRNISFAVEERAK